jgi:sugar lactone lactonase YvrE
MDPVIRRCSALVLIATFGAIAVTSAAGDSSRAAQSLPGLVAPGPNACLPGSGSRSWCGDGGPATNAKLAFPRDVAVAPDGSLVIADTGNNVIRRVTPDGVIGTLAGDGTTARRAPRDVEPAAHPRFGGLSGVAVAPDGSVLVADSGNRTVRRITHDGKVRLVMGGRRRIGTALTSPWDVVALANGDLLVADASARRVFRRTPDGAVTTLAGTGQLGSTGDGGPATAATFWTPVALAALPDGGVLIADSGAGTVRRVDPAGTITTVARTAGQTIFGVAAAPDGAVLVAVSSGSRRGWTRTEVLRYDPAPSRIVGTGRDGFDGDGPATAVALSQPGDLAVAPDGTLLIADAGNDRIRRLTTDGVLATVAGSEIPGRDVASVPPPPPPDTGPPQQGAAPSAPPRGSPCYDRHPRFEIFNFLPGDTGTLPAGRKKVTLRIQTSVTARVSLVIRRGAQRVRHRVLERVSNAREYTTVKLQLRVSTGPRYFAEMQGRSLEGAEILRCDRRKVRLR